MKGQTFPYAVASVCVLPGRELEIAVAAPLPGARYLLEAQEGGVEGAGSSAWRWRAPPKNGVYELKVTRLGHAPGTRVNAFVVVPFAAAAEGRIGDYRVGVYPEVAAARRPPGFVEVTKGNADTLLSPHFRLGQFPSKQAGGYPKYVVLDERLPLKLEAVLAAFNERHRPAKTLQVMSGYRTPFYNRLIENVANSQHIWGGAADVFVDRDGNGVMDDLDGDGRISVEDARVLFGLADGLDRRPRARWTGGLGLYSATTTHGPFVHVDVRGALARW